jgi:hypothetical protein
VNHNGADMTNQQTEHRYNDEVDLREVWGYIVRRKWMVLGIVVLCMAVGLGYGLNQTPRYEYATTIEIGSVLNRKDVEKLPRADLEGAALAPIRPVNSMLNILNNRYIPHIELPDISLQEDVRATFVATQVRDDNQAISIQSNGPLVDQETHMELHQDLAERTLGYLQGRQQRILRSIARGLQQEVDEEILDKLKEEAQQLTYRLERLDAEEQMYFAMETMSRQIETVFLLAPKSSVIKDQVLATFESHQATIQNMLDKQLHGELPQLQAEVKEALQANLQEQQKNNEAIEAKMAVVQELWKDLPPSLIIDGPSVSPRPVSRGTVYYAGLGLFSGLILALFLVLAKEFVKNSRSQRKLEN